MIRSALCAALLLALSASVQAANFTYRGQLEDGGVPAEGRYDLKLTVYADREGVQTLAVPIELNAVEVRHGGFAVGLDVDLPEHAHSAWLEVAVKSEEDGTYWPLPDRQQVTLKAQLCPESWALAGNASTSPAVNFLGTTDNQPLVLRVNNSGAMRLLPNAVAPNLVGGHPANQVGAGIHAATIGGGGDASNPNVVTNAYGTIGGGLFNTVSGNRGTVGGGAGNVASGNWSVVAGGDYNAASGQHGAIGGGVTNAATGEGSSVGGGTANTAGGQGSSVGGGDGNVAATAYSTVSGGFANTAAAGWSAVGGGTGNIASGLSGTVVGGESNDARGGYSTVSGGHANCAGGAWSWAGGQQAKVRPASAPTISTSCSGLASYPGGGGDFGTFVWADSEENAFVSTGINQFLVRAGGGFAINTSLIGFADDLVIAARQGGDADADILLRTRAGKAARIFLAESNGGLVFSTEGSRYSFGGGIDSNRWINTGANGAHLTIGGAWTNGSSRAFKHAFESIDPLDMLARVVELPISRWSYREEGSTRHVGPFAEDFAAAFGVGQDPRYISTVDASGVALAAIQGLNARIEAENANLRNELGSENIELRSELSTLHSELAIVRAELAELRDRIAAPTADGGR